MPYTLPALPYAPEALEPHIDRQTMEIHHGKHHQAYINNANKALEAYPELAAKPAEELIQNLAAVPEGIRTVIRNNAGGHANHSPSSAASMRSRKSSSPPRPPGLVRVGPGCR